MPEEGIVLDFLLVLKPRTRNATATEEKIAFILVNFQRNINEDRAHSS
jgi:hypothetical protein